MCFWSCKWITCVGVGVGSERHLPHTLKCATCAVSTLIILSRLRALHIECLIKGACSCCLDWQLYLASQFAVFICNAKAVERAEVIAVIATYFTALHSLTRHELGKRKTPSITRSFLCAYWKSQVVLLSLTEVKWRRVACCVQRFAYW